MKGFSHGPVGWINLTTGKKADPQPTTDTYDRVAARWRTADGKLLRKAPDGMPEHPDEDAPQSAPVAPKPGPGARKKPAAAKAAAHGGKRDKILEHVSDNSHRYGFLAAASALILLGGICGAWLVGHSASVDTANLATKSEVAAKTDAAYVDKKIDEKVGNIDNGFTEAFKPVKEEVAQLRKDVDDNAKHIDSHTGEIATIKSHFSAEPKSPKVKSQRVQDQEPPPPPGASGDDDDVTTPPPSGETRVAGRYRRPGGWTASDEASMSRLTHKLLGPMPGDARGVGFMARPGNGAPSYGCVPVEQRGRATRWRCPRGTVGRMGY